MRTQGASKRPDRPAGSTPSAPTVAPVLRLGRAARRWRTVVLSGFVVLFLLGSVVGQDDWWPFGPWRMFSTSTPPTGAVVAMALEVQSTQDPQWHPTAITPWSVGLNRAEVEGRIPEITADPSMLGTLAASHARLTPHAARWTAVRLVRRETVIVDRKPTGEVREKLVAEWAAS